jgi:flagellar M-ring protein FliF
VQQVKTLLQNMSPKGRLVLAGSAVAGVVVVILLMQLASQPNYTTMLTGLDPAQTGKITSALDTKGIRYEIQNNGTALAVDQSQTAQARIALASAGLPATAQPGMSLMDKTPLGASDFQQQVTYQRALEGQLAQTISQVQGVQGASVQLVLPQDQLFADQQSQSKAAVLLSGDASNLQPGAVRGIAGLVASSVKGLSPQQVTITDGNGQLLWPNGDTQGADGASTSRQAANQHYSQGLEASLDAMLARTLGPGKAQVQVSADLNTDQVTRDQLQYAKGVPVHTQNETESLRGGGGGGAAGAAGNIASFGGAGAGGNSNYTHSTTSSDFALGKTITHDVVSPGEVNRQSVALLVDKSVPAAQVASLRSAIQSAAGINPARGDTLSVSQVAFAQQPKPASGLNPQSMLGYAKYVLAGLGLLAFLFFVTRHLRRRENDALASEPVWLREIDAPTTLAELERGPAAAPSLPGPRREQNPVRGELDQIMKREPERVAAQVRAWMNED